jgi:uncharacterized protein
MKKNRGSDSIKIITMSHVIKNNWYTLLIALLALGCSSEERADVSDVPDPKELYGGFVSDRDSLLSESVREQINEQLGLVEQSGKAQVAIVLLNSIGETVPKDFAVELFNYWKIGSEEEDNGLLILLVKDQNRVEFETGYGIEGVLPDITCFQIQQDHMVPYFKAGDFDTGMVKGVHSLVAHLDGSSSPEIHQQSLDTLFNQPTQSDYYEMTWRDNVYTLKQNRKVSLLQAWSVIRNEHEFLDLPETPDTSLASITKTTDGYTYTIEIPFVFSFENALELFWSSFPFILFNTIVVTIVLFVSFGNDRYRYNKNERKSKAFSNAVFFNRPFALIFLLAAPIVLLEGYLYFFQSTDAPAYISLSAGYFAWCLYVHVHFMILIPAKATRFRDRHSKHEAFSEANRNLKTFAFIFPLPFLWLFYVRRREISRNLRELPYDCECGGRMTKLNEVQDNEFISPGDLREEELNSIDYDVWVCSECDRHRTFQYENFQSSAIHCKSCSKKTVKMEHRQVVKPETTSAAGYGYFHFLCKNCNEQTKVKFSIPKKSSSGSSGSGRSSDSGSSSGSWGGGSSGGGGAGSSW